MDMYVKFLKKRVENNEISPNSVPKLLVFGNIFSTHKSSLFFGIISYSFLNIVLQIWGITGAMCMEMCITKCLRVKDLKWMNF